MLRLNFPEFDGFAEALQGVQGQYVLRSKQQCAWRLRILDIIGVTLMAGRDGAANIYSGVCTQGNFSIFIPLRAHSAIVVNGRRFHRETIGWLAPDHMFHIGADEPTSWLSVTIPIVLVESWLIAHQLEYHLQSLTKTFSRIASTSVASLIRLAHRLFSISAHTPGFVDTKAAMEAARCDVVDATLRTLVPLDRSRQPGRPTIDRGRILPNVLEMIDTMGDAPLYTADLCREVGISERTLRNVFNETFGMAPHKYLMLVRLNRARLAIRTAHSGATLGRICTDLGFWDFGQFAKQYRQVFGELPSHALAQNRRAVSAS